MKRKDIHDVFRKQFDDIARYYDKLEPVPLIVHNAIKNEIPSQKKFFLEIGCGTGRLLELISPLFEKTVAIDFSSEMIKIAKKRISNNIEYLSISADEINFPNGSFDFIVCNALFHHMSHERILFTLNKIKNILRPGGKVYISDYVMNRILSQRADWIHDLKLVIKNIKSGNPFARFTEPKVFRDHIRSERGMHFTKNEFISIFQDSFENSKIGFYPNPLINLYYMIWEKK